MEKIVQDSLRSQPEISDELLVARVAQGDTAAFTTLYDRYVKLVYAMAVYMLGRPEAEEIVQEVFLRLWDKAESFDAGRGSFKNWFVSVARNYMLDELRRYTREKNVVHVEAIEQLIENAADPQAGVLEQTWRNERRRSLAQALKRLPAEQRRAIVLAYFGGLSHTSIAAELGWPLGTVKKRIRLGMQKLRRALVLVEEITTLMRKK